MRLFIRIFILFALAGLLTACGSMFKPTYTYIPPAAKADKICVARCGRGRNYCGNICRLKLDSCRSRAYRVAQSQFEKYKRNVLSRGGTVQKTVRDFDKGYACRFSCNCTVSFNTCYTACGGEVLEHYM